jgi:peptidyl-prolyl cis-trans isomerase C
MGLRWAALAFLLAAGCGRSGREAAARPAKAGAPAVPESEIVARIDGQPITRAEFEQALAKRAPFIKQRYSTPEKRKELLDSLVRFEVLAREAQNRGYDRDPDVVRYQKQKAIDRMIAEELDAKAKPEDIPRAELEAHYRAHLEDFTQKEAVRLEQILVRDEATAKKVAALARALGPRDERGFRSLVAVHSEDEDSKQRGGDLTFLERGSPHAPAEVVAAGFALAAGNDRVGLIGGPVKSPAGYHIIRLTQRRPQFLRPFEQVESVVRARVAEERKRQQLERWVAEMRGRVKIEVFEDKLQAVRVEADAGSQTGKSAEKPAEAKPAEKKP